MLTPEKRLAHVRGNGVRNFVSLGACFVLCMFLMRLSVCRQSIASIFHIVDTARTRALPALLCIGRDADEALEETVFRQFGSRRPVHVGDGRGCDGRVH